PTATSSSYCTTAVPGKYGYVPEDACNAQWNYYPSFAAAVAFAVLFGFVLVGHVVEAFVFRKAYCWVLIMGASWEFASFITRALGAHNQQSQALVTVSQLLLLLSPLWINAFVYMTVGRLIHFFHPTQRIWRIRGSSVAKYFVWADIISFLVQGTGGSMLSPGNSSSTIKLGLDVYMGGVGLQEGFILVFVGLIFKFQREMIEVERKGEIRVGRERWRGLVWVLYAVLALISMRIIYRLIEYSRGLNTNNPLPFHEAYMYVLDVMPMFTALIILNVWHPGRVLVGPDSSFPKLTRKEKKALKAEKKAIKAEKKAQKSERKR
ncbi:hypothetical protein K432DRAFT_254932, partial [Lepidopterella palustris CBS 459.81]